MTSYCSRLLFSSAALHASSEVRPHAFSSSLFSDMTFLGRSRTSARTRPGARTLWNDLRDLLQVVRMPHPETKQLDGHLTGRDGFVDRKHRVEMLGDEP